MISLINALATYLNKPVILADQAAPRPPYPYIGIKITSQFIPEPGHPVIINQDLPDDIEQTAISQPHMVLSVTEYAKEIASAGQIAQQAHDWFKFIGHQQLKALGYVVIELDTISNRDSMIVDDYERRRGFDVRLRFSHSIERTVEPIEQVNGKFNDLQQVIKYLELQQNK